MVNSGSSALLIALEILNLKKNDEIITPALTFSTTVTAILKNNLKPVPQGNKGKGLSKLPTQVRNKMGFMKKGGMVKK